MKRAVPASVLPPIAYKALFDIAKRRHRYYAISYAMKKRAVPASVLPPIAYKALFDTAKRRHRYYAISYAIKKVHPSRPSRT